VHVAGIDVWRGRWVAVVLNDGLYERATMASDITELLSTLSDMVAIGIDMPIGLTSGSEQREADRAAREFVGPRGSSVFPTYPREVYEADTYDTARERCLTLTGGSISRQAYGLRDRLLELDKAVSAHQNVFEVHPEVSFREMSRRPLTWSKTSWNGFQERVRVLGEHGLVLPSEIAELRHAGTEDVLDATVAAWSAARIASGAAHSFPDPPQIVDGRRVAIWC
jgi:predicted RNase H-like nuclease